MADRKTQYRSLSCVKLLFVQNESSISWIEPCSSASVWGQRAITTAASTLPVSLPPATSAVYQHTTPSVRVPTLSWNGGHSSSLPAGSTELSTKPYLRYQSHLPRTAVIIKPTSTDRTRKSRRRHPMGISFCHNRLSLNRQSLHWWSPSRRQSSMGG